MDLTKVTLFGSTFYQDGKPDWLKIDSVVLGDSSQYLTQTVNTKDIGSLLEQVASNPEVALVAYNWKVII